MPWIENVAASDIPIGFHHDAGPNSMLISITDPASWRPEAKHQFKERHNFEFLDVEEKDEVLEEAMKWGTGSQHYDRYVELRTANLHKMQSTPVFKNEQ